MDTRISGGSRRISKVQSFRKLGIGPDNADFLHCEAYGEPPVVKLQNERLSGLLGSEVVGIRLRGVGYKAWVNGTGTRI